MKLEIKRYISSLLCLVMLLGMLPAFPAAAAGDTVYVLAGGDYQEGNSDGSVLHVNSAENVANILAQIKPVYPTMDGMLFVGDYDGTEHGNTENVNNGIESLMTTVQSSYSNLNDDNTILVQGNHEEINSRIDATGGHDFEAYSVYVLNEDSYPNGGGSQTAIQTLAAEMDTWLEKKLAEGYDAPIFVTSHVPLHYSPRTVVQGDGKYAKYIFDVMNEAAGAGLNIIFLHGHDHAYGCDNYLGGEAIYLAEGDSIYIADPSDSGKYSTETLNFTYMNAGYTGYYNESGYNIDERDDSKLTMTVFAISDSSVTVERYSAYGKYNLSSLGRDGYYSDSSRTASSLGLSFNTTAYSSPQYISLSSAFVSEDATIGVYVEQSTQAEDNVSPYSSGWVTITEPVAGDTYYVYTQDTDGVNQDTDGVNTDTPYLIVDGSASNAMENNDNSGVGEVAVEIAGNLISLDTRDYEWKIDSSNRIYTTYNEGTWYLRVNKGKLQMSTNTGNATSWDISNSEGSYTISCEVGNNNNKTTYYLTSGGLSRSETSLRLFAYDGERSTETAAGLYAKADGTLSYTLKVGTSAEEALAAVQKGISVYTNTSAADPGTEIEDDTEGLVWSLDTYNGSIPGDYALTVRYQGQILAVAEVVIPASTKYYIAEGAGLYTVEMYTTAEEAVAQVMADVSVYSADDTSGSNKTLIPDEKISCRWVDSYSGSNNGPYTLELLYGETSLGTVEVKVKVRYDSGLAEGWTPAGTVEESYTYVLDTDGIEYGTEHKYIIVDDNSAVALYAASSADSTAESITVSGSTASTTTREYEYYFIETSYNGSRYELITREGDAGAKYLYDQDYMMRYGVRSSVKFQVNHHGDGLYDIHDIDGTNWYVYYNGSYWTADTDSSLRVRLYKYESSVPAGNVYAMLEGPTLYTVNVGSSATTALNKVKAGLTGYISYSADGSDPIALDDSDLSWKWLNSYNGSEEGSYWVEVSYKGVTLGVVEVLVQTGIVNNYPEYPDEGAVKVGKTATGIDFQSSGIARVELSVSGVPVKKGADVIIMLDTSSSMESNTVEGSGMTRAAVLEDSLQELIARFKTPGDDGQLLDLKVAIADFNGFYGENHSLSGTAWDRDAADMMSDDISYNANSEAKIYTGNGTLSAGAFVEAGELSDSYALNYASGTNYDYAMDAIYQLGSAIGQYNSDNNEERDLYVIFMSDGAAMQWNYYHSQGNSSLWNEWLTGAWTADELGSANLGCVSHAYYYNLVDSNGDGMLNEHRMANAIKGEPTAYYEVIRKNADLGTAAEEENIYMVPGLGATMFSISFDAQADNNVTEESMDKSIQSLASPQSGSTSYYYKVSSADELSNAFNVIGNEIAYAATNARFVDRMGGSFNLQMATSEYEVVENGATVSKTLAPCIEILSYDIYTRTDYEAGECSIEQIGDRKGSSSLLETVVFSSDGTKAYSTLLDLDGDGICGAAVNSDGSYSISDADDNIIGADGVINAAGFWYNTTPTGVAVDGVNIPNGSGSSNILPSETFYWKVGTVQTSELAVRYYVYLDGSMEGYAEAGSYATNEFAILYYDNYLGNDCRIDAVSPVMAWKAANVSYAFYLVNEKGEIIVNQTTGQTGSFANKIAVTNPVVYQEVLLNNIDNIAALEVAALGENVLPSYYSLYDNSASYTVNIRSNGSGSWEIVKGDGLVNSTYVTQYRTDDASAYSNALSNETVGDDYTHTIVWFAVLWSVQAHPDTVVIDYGLPVDISVLSNDMFGDMGKLAAVGPYTEGLELVSAAEQLAEGFGLSYTGSYGSAEADPDTGLVRYTPASMEMDGYEKFAYAVSYSGSGNPGYYYDTVTVIPATSIYYEDGFLSFKRYNTAGEESGAWVAEGSLQTDAVQSEDRPGRFSLTDANNIYGYDPAYKNMSTFSLGQAMKVHVDKDHYATAQFSFSGTGFDIISMTSNATGAIAVLVTDESGSRVASKFVNTYYGYISEMHLMRFSYNGAWSEEDMGEIVATLPVSPAPGDKYAILSNGEYTAYEYGEEGWQSTALGPVSAAPEQPENGDSYISTKQVWVPAPDTENCLYQVPALQIEGLEYGTYDVLITATYISIMDFTTDAGYDLYLDAVRIYDPANDGASDGSEDSTIEDAYGTDGEGWPDYYELRNQIISPNALFGGGEGEFGNEDTDTVIEGLVFIDGDASVGDAQLSDYVSYGPNNEVYLAPGQRVAFVMNVPENTAAIHLGIRSADGKPISCTISNVALADDSDRGLEKGDYYAAETFSFDTSTDMYYNISSWKRDIIVISNTGNLYGTEGIISLTHIKFTYSQDPDAAQEEGSGEQTESTAYTYMTPMAAILTLRAINVKTFEPEVFAMNLDSEFAVEGMPLRLSFVASEDVASIEVNGVEAVKTEYDYETGLSIWEAWLTPEAAGSFSISAVARNSEGTASQAVEASVKTVSREQYFKFMLGLFDLLGIL